MKNKTAKIYILLTSICLIMHSFSMFISEGSYIPYFFFHDELDTGMDFFNSLAEAAAGRCYTVFHTSYPPLANGFFYILSCMIQGSIKAYLPNSHTAIVNLRGTGGDLRCHQASLLLFIFFIITYVVLTFAILEYRFRRSIFEGFLLSVCVLVSYGSLSAIERGNIILYAMLFTMIFLFGYDSESSLIRRLSFFSLAVAASLKLYPAAFGLMIAFLKEHEHIGELIKKICGTVSCALILSIAPLMRFGRFRGFRYFLSALVRFNASSSGDLCYRYGAKSIVLHFSTLLFKYTGITIKDPAGLSRNILLFSIGALLFALALHAFSDDTPWKGAFDITLMIILIQPQSTDYTLLFFVPVLLMLIYDNNRFKSPDIPYYIMLLVFILPYPTLTCSDSFNLVVHHVDVIQASLVLSVTGEAALSLIRCLHLLSHSNHHHGHPMHPSHAGALSVA